MEGDLDEVIHALKVARGAELMADLEQNADLASRGALA
jgi:peptide chain release factor 1